MKKSLMSLTLLACLHSGVTLATQTNEKPYNETQPVLIGAGSGALFGGVIAGPPGAIVGGLLGIFIGQDHNDQNKIATLNASLDQTQRLLDEESQALMAANGKLEDYQNALHTADEALRQAKLAEVVSQVQFKTGEAKVSPVFHEHLNKLAKMMKDDATLTLELRGYADIRGDADYNLTLSERRALSIKDYLVAAGVDKQRLSHSAYGETDSIGSDYEEHFFDRKVVMILSSDSEVMTVQR